jgi:hypothetical protein
MRTPIQYRASSIKNPYLSPSCPFDFCRESSTNRPFSCKTNPISKTPKITPTFFYTKSYDNLPPFGSAKSKPKQTQTKPIRPPFFARYGTPKPKQTQTNPISSPPRTHRRPRAQKPFKPPHPCKSRPTYAAGFFVAACEHLRAR